MSRGKKSYYNKCTLWWCDKPYYALGYCKAHYTALKRFKSPYGVHKKELKRVEDIVNLARLISIGVTEFEKHPTEFAQQFHGENMPDNKHCVFCGRDVATTGHKPFCIARLSRSLLLKTAMVDEKEKQKHEQISDGT